MIDSAKKTTSIPLNKKKHVHAHADVVESIIDRFGVEGASLKDLLIAAVTSLGFAGFFRFNEIAIIFSPTRYFLTMSVLKYLYQRVNQICIASGPKYITLS